MLVSRLRPFGTFCLAFVLLVASGPALRAAPFDWPQWGGPDRNARSRETGLLRAWPKGGPKLAWKAAGLGVGYGTPSVADGRVFATGNRGKIECVVCLREKDGKELWAAEVGPVRKLTNDDPPGPRCTPTVDGQRVFALGRAGDLVCLESATGKEVWRKDLRKDFGGRVGPFHYCESPLVDGERLICAPGGKEASVVALDKKSGKVLWKTAVPDGQAAYASALVVEFGGVRQYVHLLNSGLVGIAADSGKLLWHNRRPSCKNNACTPIFHDGYVFATAGYDPPTALIRARAGESQAFTTEVVYYTQKLATSHGGMVLVEGYLYGSIGDMLGCVDWKTGEVVWKARGPGKGSSAWADGRLYYRNERNGTMFLVAPSPKGYVEHGRFEQHQRSRRPAWPHPVIANGRLYLRDHDVLLGYELKQR
jgi:outer membrane protein assembly factor BamB